MAGMTLTRGDVGAARTPYTGALWSPQDAAANYGTTIPQQPAPTPAPQPEPQPQQQAPQPQAAPQQAAPAPSSAPFDEAAWRAKYPAPAQAPAAPVAPAPEAPVPTATTQLQSMAAGPIDAGKGWEQVSTPGATRPGLGQRLPFVPGRSLSGLTY